MFAFSFVPSDAEDRAQCLAAQWISVHPDIGPSQLPVIGILHRHMAICL